VMNLEEGIGRFRFVLRDRDTKFTSAFDAIFAAEGIRVLRTPARAPRANAYAERGVGTMRRELLDRMLIFGRRHLVSVLAEFADRYNVHRPHCSLGQVPVGFRNSVVCTEQRGWVKGITRRWPCPSSTSWHAGSSAWCSDASVASTPKMSRSPCSVIKSRCCATRSSDPSSALPTARS